MGPPSETDDPGAILSEMGDTIRNTSIALPAHCREVISPRPASTLDELAKELAHDLELHSWCTKRRSFTYRCAIAFRAGAEVVELEYVEFQNIQRDSIRCRRQP